MRRSSEARAKRLLQGLAVPDEVGAQERAWEVARSAYAARLSVPRRRSRLRFVPVPALLLIVAAVLELTPAGAAVHRWIDNALSTRYPVATGVMSLPAPGRLLVTGPAGAWIVNARGDKRHLGQWRVATWSPRGLYVAVANANELATMNAAVSSNATIAWRRAARAPQYPSWFQPSGYRLSYVSDGTLRVITGNALPRSGAGPADWLVADRVAAIAPAWRPGYPYQLVYASATGRIVAVDADTRRRLWSRRISGAPELLAFSANGSRLLVLTSRVAMVLDSTGLPVRSVSASARAPFVDGGLSPSGETLALLTPRTVTLVDAAGSSGLPAPVFTVPHGGLSQLAWSPDGRWLLASWPPADQWIFIHASGSPRLEIVSHIAKQFSGAGRSSPPHIDGWCCTVGGGAT
jgi:hypothetical protein